MNADLYGFVAGWERKASSWDAPMGRVSPQAKDLVDGLPVIRVATPWPCADFGFETPQYFIALRPDGRRFLVDTEGAGYARYIVQLPTDAAGNQAVRS